MKKTMISILFIVVLVGSFIAGDKFGQFLNGDKKKNTITKVEYRERVVTRIKEHPDGTKEIVIDKRRETDTKTVTKVAKKDWSVTLTRSIDKIPQHSLIVQRRLLWDIKGGLYYKEGGEFGLAFTYDF